MKKNLLLIFNRIWIDIKRYGPAIFMYLIYHFSALAFFKASCPLLLSIGLPCPGCGMTRAVASVIRLDFENAFYLNPVAFLIVLFLIVFFFFRYILGKESKLLNIFFWVIVALLFVRYFYGMYKWFPDRIPYVYRQKNLLRYTINLIKPIK